MKISYKKAAALNIILGRLTTNVLDQSEYVSLLRLKNRTRKIVEEYGELQSQIHTDFKIEFNYDGSPKVQPNEIEKLNGYYSAMDALSKGEVEIEGVNFLSMEKWDALRKVNNLPLEQDELVVEWLVVL